MGLTTQILTVKPSRDARRKVAVKFLIDSGAVYSLVPGAVLRKLGLRPYRQMDFSLADGTTVSREVGDAYVESFDVDDQRTHTALQEGREVGFEPR